MWVICYKSKPAIYKKIYIVEDRMSKLDNLNHMELESYIACRSKKMAIGLFLHHVGFTWRERAKGIEVKKI